MQNKKFNGGEFLALVFTLAMWVWLIVYLLDLLGR